MIFDGWNSILPTLTVGVLAYIAVVGLVRVSAKRTLLKMNAFDLIVTVAVGSTLATILLSRHVALLTGITAFGFLISIQYLVAWFSVREGQLDEVRAAVRSQGVSGLSQVDALILQTDGSFSVISSDSNRADTALRGVQGYGRA